MVVTKRNSSTKTNTAQQTSNIRWSDHPVVCHTGQSDSRRKEIGKQGVLILQMSVRLQSAVLKELECGPVPNVMAALPTRGGALCSTPQSFGWRPLLEYRAVTLPRRESYWNLLGFTKLMKRSQPLVGWSSPYCRGILGRYCCLTSFFQIVDKCLGCEDIARQVVQWCPDGDFWRLFCILYFQQAACNRFQTCILNSH